MTPVLHRPDILLAGLAPRFLPRETVALQHAPDRGLGVANAPLGFRHVDDPRDRPQVGREPVGERALREKTGQCSLLLSGDPGRSAGAREGAERLGATRIECVLPVANSHGSHAQTTSDLGLGEAGS